MWVHLRHCSLKYGDGLQLDPRRLTFFEQNIGLSHEQIDDILDEIPVVHR
jgi:hypothetical protein